MAYKYYLTFDIGASSGKAMVIRFDGKKFHMDEIYRFTNRPVFIADTLYWDIPYLFLELKRGIQLAVQKYREIRTMSIDALGIEFGFIDRRGNLLENLIHYRDEKRNGIISKVYNIITKEEIFKLTGAHIISISSVFHMYFLKTEKAHELTHAHKFLLMPDLFNYFLTGEVCNEYTNVTSTAMYNQREKKWEEEIFNRLGISMDILPDLIMPGTQIGCTQKKVNAELEIKPLQVILPATDDNASAVTGIPVIGCDKKWAFLSLGTWAIIGMQTKMLLINPTIFNSGYGNLGGPEALNIVWKALTGFWVIQQCKEKWEHKAENIKWSDIVQAAASSKPFKSFINIDDQIFSRFHINMPQAIVNYCINSNQEIPMSIGEIARCVYESMVMGIKYHFEKLNKISYEKIELLYLIGGGSKNKLLCQWIANGIGIPVYACEGEVTSVGNFIMQLIGTKEIKNLDEGKLLAKNSIKITFYEPEEENIWGEAYGTYLDLLLHYS